MGYAIFTARKLMLTNRINQLNFRIMQLSQQQQTLADNAARQEMAMGNLRNLFSSVGNMLTMGLQVSQQQAQNARYEQIQGAGINKDIPTQQLWGTMQAEMQPYTTAINSVSLFQGMLQEQLQIQSQAQFKQIKDLENNIELQRKSLETQVKAAEAELQEVEKAEDNQIKQSAPKFA